jgi:hypothetical protein
MDIREQPSCCSAILFHAYKFGNEKFARPVGSDSKGGTKWPEERASTSIPRFRSSGHHSRRPGSSVTCSNGKSTYICCVGQVFRVHLLCIYGANKTTISGESCEIARAVCRYLHRGLEREVRSSRMEKY